LSITSLEYATYWQVLERMNFRLGRLPAAGARSHGKGRAAGGGVLISFFSPSPEPLDRLNRRPAGSAQAWGAHARQLRTFFAVASRRETSGIPRTVWQLNSALRSSLLVRKLIAPGPPRMAIGPRSEELQRFLGFTLAPNL